MSPARCSMPRTTSKSFCGSWGNFSWNFRTSARAACGHSAVVDAERIARLRGLEAHLRAHIRGQDHALPRIAAAFARGEMGVTDPVRPRGSFLFVGPTGSGKTETFSCATDYVFGHGHLVVFDMSEYQDKSAVNKLLGE